MTSLKQIDANRRNALKSTGPKSVEGKMRASRNAVRHGLTAETVLEPIENPEDYKAFEEALTADYEAKSVAERELVLRLASLLWRLRRTTSIETALLGLDDEDQPRQTNLVNVEGTPAPLQLHDRATYERCRCSGNLPPEAAEPSSISSTAYVESDIARRFLRAANLGNGVFERLGRYEVTLWRQVRQTIFTLEALRWRSSHARHSTPRFWRRIETPTD
jgi:hypothetical protein